MNGTTHLTRVGDSDVSIYAETELLARVYHADDECEAIMTITGHERTVTETELVDRILFPDEYRYSLTCACLAAHLRELCESCWLLGSLGPCDAHARTAGE